MRENLMPEPDVVHVISTIASDGKTPMVGWHLNGKEGKLTLLEARERAETMFLAAAIAETEARIALKISGLKDAKGFGAPSKKAEKSFYQINMLMRDQRPTLPEGVRPIFGWKTQQPLIEIDVYGEPFIWETDLAREHARWLLEVAEASETDRFLYAFLAETVDFSPGDSNALLQAFSEFRKRVRLEDLLER